MRMLFEHRTRIKKSGEKINLQLSKQEHHVKYPEWNQVLLCLKCCERESCVGMEYKEAQVLCEEI